MTNPPASFGRFIKLLVNDDQLDPRIANIFVDALCDIVVELDEEIDECEFINARRKLAKRRQTINAFLEAYTNF